MKRALDIFLVLLAVTIIGAFVCCRARAEQCTSWTALKQVLAELWGEVPIGGGLVSRDVIVQVLASPDGASFTVVEINKAGIACSIAAGFGWEPGKNPPKPGRPS